MFDCIIGNPPYQRKDDGTNKTSYSPTYQFFVLNTLELCPRLVCIIIPSRFYTGSKGMEHFREVMFHKNNLEILVDYFSSNDVFPSTDISGGICYFLYNRDKNNNLCKIVSHLGEKTSISIRPLLEFNSFVRFNEAISILKKLDDMSFIKNVSSRKPFGIDTRPIFYPESKNTIFCYAYPKNGCVDRKSIIRNHECIEKYKVVLTRAYGERGSLPYTIYTKPFIAYPDSVVSESYLICYVTSSLEEANNVISYMKTRFFRFLLMMNKGSQNISRSVFEFVPMQDFSHEYTDELLYRKYHLSSDEISFIENSIKKIV